MDEGQSIFFSNPRAAQGRPEMLLGVPECAGQPLGPYDDARSKSDELFRLTSRLASTQGGSEGQPVCQGANRVAVRPVPALG